MRLDDEEKKILLNMLEDRLSKREWDLSLCDESKGYAVRIKVDIIKIKRLIDKIKN